MEVKNVADLLMNSYDKDKIVGFDIFKKEMRIVKQLRDENCKHFELF